MHLGHRRDVGLDIGVIDMAVIDIGEIDIGVSISSLNSGICTSLSNSAESVGPIDLAISI